MQSNGNDFLITEDSNLIEKTVELSDRIKNIGFDQLLYFQNGAMPELRVFNADGSEANNCVNGLRWSLHNTSAMSAIPNGMPGCPELAFSTASTDKNLIALTNLSVIKVK